MGLPQVRWMVYEPWKSPETPISGTPPYLRTTWFSREIEVFFFESDVFGQILRGKPKVDPYLVGGLVAIFYFPRNIGNNHHPN